MPEIRTVTLRLLKEDYFRLRVVAAKEAVSMSKWASQLVLRELEQESPRVLPRKGRLISAEE